MGPHPAASTNSLSHAPLSEVSYVALEDAQFERGAV